MVNASPSHGVGARHLQKGGRPFRPYRMAPVPITPRLLVRNDFLSTVWFNAQNLSDKILLLRDKVIPHLVMPVGRKMRCQQFAHLLHGMHDGSRR